MKIARNLVNGLLAGILISIGGSVFLACRGGGVLNNAIGATFFSVALLCICIKGYALFTGKIGFIPEKHDREAFSVLLWGLLGNAVATILIGLLLYKAMPDLASSAKEICRMKLDQAWWQTLVRGIFCGVLMYLAVSIYRDKKSIVGILFCVPVFILAGFEHSIANMFYFGAAGMISLKSVLYLLLVVIGNSIGGMLMPILERIVHAPRPPAETGTPS